MPLTVRVTSITFSDGTKIELEGADRVVFVGPNNAGKSAALRSIFNGCAGNTTEPVIRELQLSKEGNDEELKSFLNETFLRHEPTGNFHTPIAQAPFDYFQSYFRHDRTLAQIHPLFVSMLNATGRIESSNPVQAVDFYNQPKSHPLHFLHQDRELRRRLAMWFRRAFGTGIAVDFMAGALIPLHVGDDVEIRTNESPMDRIYVDRLRSFPRIETQGDGMRSFVGLLLHVILTFHRIILVDEPEAFLHPPQARLLGMLLGNEVTSEHQLFLATHSGDLLKGLLESECPGLRIIRLRRVGSVNHTRELTAESAAEVWRDPVLRYSNILDGVFHEKVVVCEADGDCRFYNAIADALRSPENHPYARDVMFTQSGGKGGIPKLLRALRKLDVPVVAVADFDLLRETGQFRAVVEALGGDFYIFQDDLARVRREIDALSTSNVRGIKKEVISLIGGVADDMEAFPRGITTRVTKALRTPPGWQRASKIGIAILSPGEAHVAGKRLLEGLAQLGLFVVPCGELESFLPEIELEKNDWVYTALERYRNEFDRAPELEQARFFVAQLIAQPV